MAAAILSEGENFATCGICFHEYDNDKRKPKFLQCAHTVCLDCLRVIASRDSVICPMCRQTSIFQNKVDGLPNNSYALFILKLTKDSRMKQPAVSSSSATNNLIEVNFCPTCGSPVKSQCAPWIKAIRAPLRNNTFVLGQSIFILELLFKGKLQGVVHIRPVSTYYDQDSLKRLGDFCFQSKKIITNPIEKAVPGRYVVINVEHQEFQPYEGNFKNSTDGSSSSSDEDLLATKPNEVGIILNTVEDDHRDEMVVGFSLFFPLEVSDPSYENPHFVENILFGHVVDHKTLEPFTKVSRTSKYERSSYTATLESK